MNYSLVSKTAASLLLIGVLVACGSSGSGSSDTVPSSGNSNSSAPISFIGKTYVGKVTKNDGGQNVLAVNDVFTYTFVDSTTIYGTGFVPVVTTGWDYVASGNTATVRLFFDAGHVEQHLIFNTPTSGTYHSDATLNSGTTGWHEGIFTISPYTGGTGATSGGTTGGTTTGQVVFWTSRTTTLSGSITASVDNVSIGSITSYLTSAPTCGAANAITKTLAAGTHSFSAVDGTLTWGPANFTVTAGGCLTYQIN